MDTQELMSWIKRESFRPFVLTDTAGREFKVERFGLVRLVAPNQIMVFQSIPGESVLVEGPTRMLLEDIDRITAIEVKKAG